MYFKPSSFYHNFNKPKPNYSYDEVVFVLEVVSRNKMGSLIDKKINNNYLKKTCLFQK